MKGQPGVRPATATQSGIITTRGGTLVKKFRGLGLFGIAIFFLFSMMFGTSPRPAPYYQYIVQGTITRDNGGQRQDFVVSLVGRFSQPGLDSAVELQGNILRSTSAASKAVTDSSGRFTLDVIANIEVDSLAIRVSGADKPIYVGSMFTPPSTSSDITETTQAQMSGCRGCETVTPSESFIVGHRFYVPDQVYTIPF
jgi:hypothetical protein